MTLGHAIESCTLQLSSLRPFDETPGPNSAAPCAAAINGPCSKRICRAGRAASFSFSSVWDLSNLSLFQGYKHFPSPSFRGRRFARKRRRRGGSRSVSCRSSNRRCLSAKGACSDFLMAAGSTDSSGELFGEGNWASDVSERNLRREFVISGYRRALFWGEECGENTSQLEMVGENSLQKSHHQCRCNKHDLRMADAPG